MPLEMLITGRIATLAGDTGFGWVEAIGIRDGRVAFAGSEVYLETRADPFTERIALEPDEVAIPGLTDAHLHLARVAAATRQIDLTDAATIADDLETVAPGRRCAIWAHDHHALLASHAALEASGVTRGTPDPAGGVIRRT